MENIHFWWSFFLKPVLITFHFPRKNFSRIYLGGGAGCTTQYLKIQSSDLVDRQRKVRQRSPVSLGSLACTKSSLNTPKSPELALVKMSPGCYFDWCRFKNVQGKLRHQSWRACRGAFRGSLQLVQHLLYILPNLL